MRQRIEVAVGANAFVHQPADQSVNGAVAVFSKDIPTGDLEPRPCTDYSQIGALGEARGIHLAIHAFDVFGVFVLHVALEYITDHMLHRVGTDRGGIAFTPASDSSVGGDFDQNPVSPAPAWGGRCCDDDVEVLQFHFLTLFRCFACCPVEMEGGAAPVAFGDSPGVFSVR